LQERLYAHGRWALLVVLQGLDTAGIHCSLYAASSS
jgi:hypothetical protein